MGSVPEEVPSKEENSKRVGVDLWKYKVKQVTLFTLSHPGHFKEFKDRTIWDGCSYIGEHYSVIFNSRKAFYFVTRPKVHLPTRLIEHGRPSR